MSIASHRNALRRFAAPLLLAGLVACAPPAEEPAPGLVLVTLDTFRADHLGASGHPEVRTPHLDRLARSGTWWTEAICAIPLTTPSHATILTGRTPRSHGLVRNRQALPGPVRSVAQELRDAGWRTGAVVSAGVVLDPEFGLDRGFDSYEVVDPDQRPASGEGTRTTERATAWIRERGGPGSFLWVHYFDAHLPYLPPAPLDRLYDPHYSGDLDAARLGIQEEMRAAPSTPPEDVRHLAARYAGEVTFLDRCVGELARAVPDGTRLLITADHGEGLFEHERYFGHDVLLFETSLRVPMLLTDSEPRLDLSPARSTDVAPTLLGLAGRDAPLEMEGRDLIGEPEPHGDARTFVVETHPDRAKSEPLYGLRTDDAKVIWRERGRQLQAFDLESDPRERTDLSESGERFYRVLHEDLLLDLRNRPPGTAVTVDEERGGMSAEDLERMRALGYVD